MTDAEPPKTNASPPKKRRRSTAVKKKKTAAPAEPAVRATLAPTHILIIDNGGDTLKYGWATDEAPKLMPNMTARMPYQLSVLVGDELQKVQNPNSLIGVTRSTERGIITNLGNQTQVWKRLLDHLGVIISVHSEAASSLGWKVSKTTVPTPPKTIPAPTIAVLLLLPPHYPRLVCDQILNVWLEDFGVSHVGLAVSSVCAAKPHPTYQTSCVVDLGWSQSLMVPTFQSKPILLDGKATIKRVPIGGRHLTNMFKYYMSYRQYNLMDQEVLLRDVLEKLGYLSLQVDEDLELARTLPSGRRHYDRDYVLPDYQTTFAGIVRVPLSLIRQQELEKKEQAEEEDDDDDDDDEDDSDVKTDDEENDEDDDDVEGYDENGTAGDKNENNDSDGDNDEETPEQARVRIRKERAEAERRKREEEEEEQVLRVSVERFTIPEALFRPVDAGLTPDLVGLSHAIVQSIQACPKPYQPALYQSIHVTGGLSQLPNLKARLEQEMRTLIPNEYELDIQMAQSPIHQAWLGAREWIKQSPYTQWSISREEWEAASKRKAYSRLLLLNGGTFV
jgi:actin-related protein 6